MRPKYACPECVANVVIAERLPEPIEKGLPGPWTDGSRDYK